MQMNPLRFEFVTSGGRLSAVAEPWAALWSGTEASAFQSHPWISAWWASLGVGAAELLVAVAWDRDAAVAILPLAIERRRGARVLVWAGEAVSPASTSSGIE